MATERKIRTGLWYLVWRLAFLVMLSVLVHAMTATHLWRNPDRLSLELTGELGTVKQLDASGDAWRRAVAWTRGAYSIVFEASGFNDMVRDFSRPVAMDPFATEMRKVVVYFWDEIRAAMISVQMIGERLSLLVSAWPLVAVIMLVALCDGWASRWLRRARAGRESAFLYHRLKRGFFLSLVLMWAAYLLPPVRLNPIAVMGPGLVLAGVSLRYTVTYFKKYF